MLHIKFKYRDEASDNKWVEQECVVSSLKKCKEIYGLGQGCEYTIMEMTEVKK